MDSFLVWILATSCENQQYHDRHYSLRSRHRPLRQRVSNPRGEWEIDYREDNQRPGYIRRTDRKTWNRRKGEGVKKLSMHIFFFMANLAFLAIAHKPTRGLASTSRMRTTISLGQREQWRAVSPSLDPTVMPCWLAPIRVKQLSMAAVARVIWLCACLR